MNAVKARLLVVEDDDAMASLLRDDLGLRGYEVVRAGGPGQAMALLREGAAFDAVVTDVRLGSQDGIDFVEALRSRARGEGTTPPGVVVITAFGSLETAVRAFRAGAADFLTKPFELSQLALSIERVLHTRRLKGEIQRLRREVGWKGRREIVAESPPMREVLELVNRAAESDTTVLVTGASGTGKEVIARALHERSPRADGPFVAINCAALPEQLLESELFGHRKGAFTDARNHRDGLFKSAEGGTIFLDEIGELPLSLQPKLLRVLQERELTPLGASRPEEIDVRVVTATNQNLEELVTQRRFREDLYYRLNVIRLELPPLSARPEDVLPLADYFLSRLAAKLRRKLVLSAAAQAALTAYRWPGNVRELENALERAAALCRTEEIELTDLPPAIVRPPPSHLVESAIQRRLTLEELAIEYCAAVVRSYGGNQSHAARHLDIDRKTLAKKLQPAGQESDDAA